MADKVGSGLADQGWEYGTEDVLAFLDQTCDELIDLGGCVYGLAEFDDPP